MKTTTFRKLKKHYLGLLSIGLIVVFMLISGLGYLVTPDSTPSANGMHVELANQPIGTSVSFWVQASDHSCEEKGWFHLLLYGTCETESGIPVQKIDDSNGKVLPLGALSEDEDSWIIMGSSDRIVTKRFWLGTDKYGRDLLSRLILGGRVSIAVGFISVAISLLIGIPLGAIAGYFGGWVDKWVMWLVNVIWSIPTLLMVIALTFVLGKGFWQVFVAVGLTMWVEVARVVRGQVMGLRKLEYVEAAKVLGFSSIRIIWKHILPNAWAPVIVISAANFASAILMESGLSFLGIGAQPPVPSWGGIIRDHYAYIITGEAHLSMLPGLCIMLLVLSFMILGNTLRDVLDVKVSE